MGFSKHLLVSAIAIASTSVHAMEALDEEGLSETSAQAGLNITITPPAGVLSFSMLYHDLDGIPTTTFAGSTYTSAGALIIGNTPGGTGMTRFSVTNTSGYLFKVDVGAKGSAATSTGLININLTSTAATTWHSGDIRVGVSNAGTGLDGGGTITNVVVQDITVSIGAGNLMNVQLGNEDQGNMAKLNASFAGGLTISNFNLVDAAGSALAGGVKISTVTIKDCSSANCATIGANLATNIGIDANTSGIQIGFNSLGDPTNGSHIMLAGITIGSFSGTTTIGDFELNGFNPTNTTLQITGH